MGDRDMYHEEIVRASSFQEQTPAYIRIPSPAYLLGPEGIVYDMIGYSTINR